MNAPLSLGKISNPLDMDKDMMYCFLDTNVLLHYKTFDEVKWQEVLGVEDVCLVIAPTVTWELDKFKDDSRNSWRQQRAKMLIRKLDKYLGSVSPVTPVQLPRETWIMDLVQEPAIDWGETGLDPEIRDDRILATILEFRSSHADVSVQLAARDLGIRRKARHLSIKAISPPDQLKEVAPASPEIKRIRELERELAKYKNRLPNLPLSFLVGEETSQRLHVQPESGIDNWLQRLTLIDMKVAKEREKLQSQMDAAPSHTSDQEIEKFRQEVDCFLGNFRRFLVYTEVVEHGIVCELQLVLNNDGSAPATDVDIDLHFPDHSFLVGVHDERSVFGVPYPPDPPKVPWITKPRFGLDMFSMSPTSIVPEQLQPKGPTYALDDRSRVSYWHPKLRHQEPWHMSPIRAWFPNSEERAFQIHFWIHCDEIIDPLSGELIVIIDRDNGGN